MSDIIKGYTYVFGSYGEVIPESIIKLGIDKFVGPKLPDLIQALCANKNDITSFEKLIDTAKPYVDLSTISSLLSMAQSFIPGLGGSTDESSSGSTDNTDNSGSGGGGLGSFISGLTSSLSNSGSGGSGLSSIISGLGSSVLSKLGL